MASFPFTKSRFESDINDEMHNRIDMLPSTDRLVEKAARKVTRDVMLRSAQRQVQIPGGLYEKVQRYPAPNDLSAERIVDIIANSPEKNDRIWSLTTAEVMRNTIERDMAYDQDDLVAIEQENSQTRMLLSSDLDYTNIEVSPLTDQDEGNNWQTFGDADNPRTDSVQYAEGGSSVSFDLAESGQSEAGVENDGLDAFELEDDYLDANSAVFVWFYLPQTDDVNGFIARIGSSSADYYEMRPTGKNDETELTEGWNLVQFDLQNATESGAVNNDSIVYAAAGIQKETSLQDVDNFRVNQMVIRVGRPYWVKYYTDYPWVGTDGQYRRAPQSSQDMLVADDDEYDIYLKRAEVDALKAAQDDNRANVARQEYEEMITRYQLENPANAMIKSTQYHDFRNPGQYDNNYYQN